MRPLGFSGCATLAARGLAVTRDARHIAVDSAASEGYPTPMTWDAELDARGLLCPLPVLKAGKRLNALAPGTLLRVLADDPAAAIDIPHFCAETGHALLAQEDLGQSCRAFLIRARGPAAHAPSA